MAEPASTGELDEDLFAYAERLRQRAERMRKNIEDAEEECSCEECGYENSEREGYAMAADSIADELSKILAEHTKEDPDA